jgi:hypothetical protein
MSKQVEPNIRCLTKYYDQPENEVKMVIGGERDAVLEAAKNWWDSGKVRTYRAANKTDVHVVFTDIRSPRAAGWLFEEFRQEVAKVLAS